MIDHNRALKHAFVIATVAMVITSAGSSAAQTHVTGAAGSTDVERVEPILIDDTFVYSVKMLCGTVLSDLSFRQFPSTFNDALMAPGTYLSAVNYHHPGEEQIEVENSAIVQSGQIGFIVVGITPPNTMGHLDCGGFVSNLNGGGTPDQNRQFLKTNFVEGFIVLRSPNAIAVTAVYTFKNVEAPSFVTQEFPVQPPRTP